MNRHSADMTFYTQGGRISFRLLRQLAEEGMVHGEGTLALGNRQEIILPQIGLDSQDYMRDIVGARLPEFHPKRPNIVTTRAVAPRSQRTAWLGEGGYDAILQGFQSNPAIAVDIVDPVQHSVPLFTGQAHFVATPEPDYWQLYLNVIPEGDRIELTQAIHSQDIASVTGLVHQHYLAYGTLDPTQLQAAIEQLLGNRLRTLGTIALHHNNRIRPIVGFKRDPQSDRFSLGIPVQRFPLPGPFLIDLSMLADRCGITTAHLSPWKSLLVHGIPPAERNSFEKLLLRHRINLNPGAWDHVTLNGWRSPRLVHCAHELISALNTHAPHAADLTLALVDDIMTLPDTPIVIRAKRSTHPLSRFQRSPRFSLFARDRFEHGNPTLVSHGRELRFKALLEALLALIEDYGATEINMETKAVPKARTAPLLNAHRCSECGTEYSALYGDPLGGIKAGTPFDELPADWACPTCEAPLGSYKHLRGSAA